MSAQPSPDSPIPLYHQIATVLRQRVVDGTYQPGERLVREDDLAAEFEVSRATVRQAVGELVRVNLLTRQQGRGTFVAENAREQLGRIVRGDLDALVAAGEVRRTRLRDIELRHGQPLTAAAARVLELDGDRGTIVQRTRLLDDVAFAYTVDTLPDAHGKLLRKARLRSEGVLQQLEAHGVQLGGAKQTVRAELADLRVSEALEVPLGSAVLFVERLLWDERERPVELFQSWYRGDRYEYTVTYDRGGSGDLARHFA